MGVKWTWIILLIITIRNSSRISVHGHGGGYCRIENRTVTLNICKTPPTIVLPTCVGFCHSSTRWEFRSHRFVSRTSACTVTQHRTEEFVCPDSTHTSVQLMIALECSCERYSCETSPSQLSRFSKTFLNQHRLRRKS